MTIGGDDFTKEHYQELEVYTKSGKRIHLQEYTLSEITGDPNDEGTKVYGYYEFTNRKGDLPNSDYISYIGVPKKKDGEAESIFENQVLVTTGYLNVKYNDETEYVRMVDTSKMIAGENITDNANITNQTYGFNYSGMGYWHNKYNTKYENGAAHTAPTYTNRLLSSEIYNNAVVEFTLVAGVNRSYGKSTGSSASAADYVHTGGIVKKSTSTGASANDDEPIDTSIARNQKFYLIQGDDHIAVEQSNGQIRFLDDKEYDIAAVTVPKDDYNRNYTVYAATSPNTRYSDYEVVGSGDTSADKTFRLDNKYKAVYVKMEDVSGSYQSTIKVSVRFHLDRDITPGVNPDGNLVNFSYMRVVYKDGNEEKDYIGVSAKNFEGSFTDQIAAMDYKNHKDEIKNDKAVDSINEKLYLYRGYSNVFIRKSITKLESKTVTIGNRTVDNYIKTIASEYGGGYTFPITTSGTIQADNSGPLKKFSIHTLLPADLVPNEDLSEIQYSESGKWDGIKLTASGTDTSGNPITDFSDYVKYEVRKFTDGRTVVSAYFDFSDAPLEIQKLTSVQITYPVRVDYLAYKTGSKEYTVYSYTSIQDTGVDEIKGSNIKYDGVDIDNVSDTVYVAESSSKINGTSGTNEWVDAAVKSAATYFSDGYTTTNTIKTFSNSNSANATNKEKTKYSYRLQMNVGSSVRDIVMYDNIEPKDKEYKKDNNSTVSIQSEWHGKLLSVDTSYLQSFKAKNNDPYDLQYTVFYSTEEYEEYEGISNKQVTSGNWKAMTTNDGIIWTIPDNETGEARSVAININTGSDNKYFKMLYLYAIINMQAPENLPETETDYTARNAYHLSYEKAPDGDIQKASFMFSDITSVELREYLPIVTFTKTDSTNDLPLTDAEFAIYKAKDDGNGNYIKADDTIVDSGTVNQLGKWTTDKLHYDTYYLLDETKVPTGYVAPAAKLIYIDSSTKELRIDGKVITAVGDYEDEYEATIQNDRKKGTVQLTKKDSDDDSILNLAGAEFALYKSDGEQLYLKKVKDGEYEYDENESSVYGTLVTSTSGLKITGLPWGNYYITETAAPEGYSMDSTPSNFSVGKTNVDNAIEITKSNTEQTASINLTKYDASSGDPLDKAWYTLQKKNANGGWEKVSTGLRTNSTGEITAEGLKFGIYRFVETNAPVGYALKGEDDDANTAKSPRRDQVKITDEEGYEVDGLDLTTYVKTSGEITLDANTVGLTIEVNDENERKKGTATISKTSSSGLPLAGAKFDLYKVDDSGEGTLIKKNLTTGADGKITAATGDELTEGLYGVKDLDWGNYYFVESYAPKDYKLSEEKYRFEIKPDNVDETQTATATDEQKTGSIKLIKTAGEPVGTYTAGALLPGAVFSLYTKDGVLVKLRAITVDEVTEAHNNGETEVDNTWYVCDDNGDLTTVITSDRENDKGELKIRGIAWGSYYLEEVQAPPGFAPAEKVRFAVNADTCQAVQELDCEDPAMTCEIIINKKIDDRVDSFGTPTFLFKIKGINGTKGEWLKTITINSGLTGTTKLSVPAGEYTVEEIKVSRYTLTGVKWEITNNGVNQGRNGTDSEKATFTLGSDTVTQTGDTATVNFDNKLENYDKYGHTAAATNVVPKERKITGISVEYLDVVPVDLNKADSTFRLKSDSLVAYIIYDDGEREEMNSAQKTALEFLNDSTYSTEMPTVSNTVNDVNSTQMINAKWTNGGKTYRTTFDVTIGSAQTTPTQKVIFKVDADNSCYFLNNGKRSSSNTVYYRDGAAVIGQYISPTFVDPSNTQATSWADALEDGTTVATDNASIISYIAQHPDQTEFTVYLKLGRLVIDIPYTGEVNTFTVPADGYYLLETWGASGGDGYSGLNYANRTKSSHAGHGGYSYANVYLTKGTVLYTYVGGQGTYGSGTYDNYNRSRMGGTIGGYNGGGNAGNANSGSGGGMTHISIVDNPVQMTVDSTYSYKAYTSWDSTGTLVVAGGGGGADNANGTLGGGDDGSGGYGGGEKGGGAYVNGIEWTSGNGIGGAQQQSTSPVTKPGVGGFGTNSDTGGGGGGWYGGTSSNNNNGGGGGGSGHVSLGDVSGGGQTAKVVSGATIGGNQEVPTYDGANMDPSTEKMIGNIGNGYARITFTENEIPLSYSGQVQSFTADRSGYYKLEGWGAQGGSANQTYDTTDTTSYEGGRGGYSTGMVYLEANQTIYYAVGGEGQSQHYVSSNNSTLTAKGGFNGGGNGYMGANVTTDWYGGGGGATHFATSKIATGVLSDYSSNQDDVLLVAGGGGGSYYYYNSVNKNLYKTIGGYGGGENGGEGVVLSSTNSQIPSGITIPGGGQTAPATNSNYIYGTFGQGASYSSDSKDGGGGGGWYGGAKLANVSGGWHGMSGGGGSGHVNYTSLINGKTVGGNETIPLPDGTTGTGNTGNGAARITYVGNPGTVQYTNVNKIQTFTAPVTGYYELQAWGAQGGGSVDTETRAPTVDSIIAGEYNNVEGGKGGYSYGTVLLEAGQTIYIGVGGKGEEVKKLDAVTTETCQVPGGFNGGGYSYFQSPNHVFALGSGGGATHFALTLENDGTLANYENNKGDVLLVAGGGGGSALSRTKNGSIFNQGLGGYGGGEIGGSTTPTSKTPTGGGTTATGGTQTAGGQQEGGSNGEKGSFGQGAQGAPYATGGGGGWYGGGGSRIMGGAGGSGHVNTAALDTTDYTCATIGGDQSFKAPDGTSYETGHSGDGAAQVRLVKALETIDYSYTGAVRTFVAPKTGTYKLEAWGASGGDTSHPDQPTLTATGGKGGYSYGTVTLTAGQPVYICVGGKGTDGNVKGTKGAYVAGGYNGGGSSTLWDDTVWGSGGGATHFALSLKDNGTLVKYVNNKDDVLLVAGGGGGSGVCRNGSRQNNGGFGGGETAGDGAGWDSAYSKGGSAFNNSSFGCGIRAYDSGSGSGGGWYGGLGGFDYGSSAGGGSGHVNDILSNAETIAGDQNMPTHDGTNDTMKGNTGNGYARITLIG